MSGEVEIITVCLSLCLLGGPGTGAPQGVPAPPMRYITNAPESEGDVRYRYHWEILRTALEKTLDTWGPFELRPGPRMSESRQSFELKEGRSLTVMCLSTKPEMEATLLPVRIPVDKNLGGYCVFLIRREDQPRFTPERIRTLDDLRKLSLGLGYGWIDVDILRRNGFKVVTGSDYDGLFTMLVNRRFDAFLRATVEVLDEVDQRKAALPSLHIEENFILYYPLPMYFWFPRTPEGERLRRRAREGMMAMIRDGSFDAIFRKHQQPKIDRLHLKRRKIFRLENPFLGPETPFADKRLWYDPVSSR
ncbi:MAG TPA: hypothetical protein VJ570_10365 [Holophagaceae bacterium]|nr:hypothetical protein [Holophagaceae bacterium]